MSIEIAIKHNKINHKEVCSNNKLKQCGVVKVKTDKIGKYAKAINIYKAKAKADTRPDTRPDIQIKTKNTTKSMIPVIEPTESIDKKELIDLKSLHKKGKEEGKDNVKKLDSDIINSKDKVNIVIKACKNITSKQALLVIPITKFFSNRQMLNKIITILKGESISLRLIDWFVTNYCKKFNVLYNVNDFKGEQLNKTADELRSFDNYIIVHNNYKGQLKAYSKRNFDPFCRRNRIRFYYEDNKYFITTVGQLNFFKWALEQHIVEYIEKHLKEIDIDMNLRCETVKKINTKLNPINAITTDEKTVVLPITLGLQLDEVIMPNITPLINTTNTTDLLSSTLVSTKKKKGFDNTETQIQTKIKKNGATRKKRKEISTAASKSLSIHNFPTTLVFD